MIYNNKTIQFSVYNWDSGSGVFVQDTTNVTMPPIEYLSDTMAGAGIGGEIDMPAYAQTGSMTLEIGLRTENPESAKLLAPGYHKLEVRWVIDTIDTATGKCTVAANKCFFGGYTKSLDPGSIENNASQEATLSMEVIQYKRIRNGETLWDIDKTNNGFSVSDVDYGQQIRNNL